MSIEEFKVIRFTEERVPNPYPGGMLSWQIYHRVRNSVVRTCRKRGPTGPLGEIASIEGSDDSFRQAFSSCQHGDDDPSHYIIDDQYNHERYLYSEL